MTYNEAAFPFADSDAREREAQLDLSEEMEATLSTAQERAFALDGDC